jgi:xanthine dehydrogenase accessory factor
MLELVSQLANLAQRHSPVVCCRLVETRGSTPQKAGAMMLVFPDGTQSGTLGGGCVEAEVKRRALRILAGGNAEIAQFQLDSDYGWDDGLICGGRMTVLVDPMTDPAAADYYRKLHELASSRRGFIEAVAFDADKSRAPATACYLFDDTGSVSATLRGGANGLPPSIGQHVPDLADRPRPSAANGLAFLPTLGRCRLLIVGGGHVGQALASLAADLDFDVWVVDDRAEYASAERFPTAQKRIVGPIGEILPTIDITSDTYCVIVTRGHNHDEEALHRLVDRGARYVGLIGSRRKIKLIFDDLLAEGVAPETLQRVYAPLGIDIGSQTVAEIAVSIAAELVSHRNRAGVVPGRPESVAVGANA